MHIQRGDHSLIVAQVIEAMVRKAPEGRTDDAILWMKDLGEKVFYGGQEVLQSGGRYSKRRLRPELLKLFGAH